MDDEENGEGIEEGQRKKKEICTCWLPVKSAVHVRKNDPLGGKADSRAVSGHPEELG